MITKRYRWNYNKAHAHLLEIKKVGKFKIKPLLTWNHKPNHKTQLTSKQISLLSSRFETDYSSSLIKVPSSAGSVKGDKNNLIALKFCWEKYSMLSSLKSIDSIDHQRKRFLRIVDHARIRDSKVREGRIFYFFWNISLSLFWKDFKYFWTDWFISW